MAWAFLVNWQIRGCGVVAGLYGFDDKKRPRRRLKRRAASLEGHCIVDSTNSLKLEQNPAARRKPALLGLESKEKGKC
jgi:hypothetical protein